MNNIFYANNGNTQTNLRAASVGEAAQLLGVSENQIEDAGAVGEILAGFHDIVIDTTAYDQWEK